MYIEILEAGLLSAFLTLIIAFLLIKLGKKCKAGNLYSAIRGGTPRAVGLAPLLVLLLLFPDPYNYLIGIMGFLAFLDDLTGRKKLPKISVELGQLCRGLGIIMVILLGYPYLGLAAVVVALMIQPMNIADMQPGSACSAVIIMSSFTAVLLYLSGGTYYILALIVLATCIGYAPLDYKGSIMMGEVGNHSFAVALGIIFALWGGILGAIALLLVTTLIIAFIRRRNLQEFLEQNLDIKNPVFGDYFMDVLTGGGLGDLFRRFLFRNKQIVIENNLLRILGFRRLFYNPYAE
jgi:UDP-GlcNAc:undecaprenyl-phosphate GlcNAc-1-phosphate transferase